MKDDSVEIVEVPIEQVMYVEAEDDTYTNNLDPNSPMGDLIKFQVVSDTASGVHYDAFLRFVVPNINITRAYLRLYHSADETPTGSRVRLKNTVDPHWNEETVTFNNRPAIGNELSVLFGFNISSGYWSTINITNYVIANKGKAIGLIMMGVDDPLWRFFDSKERGNGPKLRIFYT